MVGVIVGVARIGAAVLWFFRGALGCFGSGKKKTDNAGGREPPAYDTNKEVGELIHEVLAEHNAKPRVVDPRIHEVPAKHHARPRKVDPQIHEAPVEHHVT